MPELPEVETVKKGLVKNILNSKINFVEINIDKLRYPIDKEEFSNIKDKTILDIQRRGKHLIIFLDDDLQIIIHLGMSGVIKIENTGKYTFKKHDHIVLKLENDLVMSYNDPRRFGYWLINKNTKPLEHKVLSKHGVEPLTDDFNADYLFLKLQKTTRKIKQTIMDNSIVVGVGNIYASEALFDSAILPTRKSNSLNKDEISKLVTSIKSILNKAIAQGGTTLKDYKNSGFDRGHLAPAKTMSCLPIWICSTAFPIQCADVAQADVME